MVSTFWLEYSSLHQGIPNINRSIKKYYYNNEFHVLTDCTHFRSHVTFVTVIYNHLVEWLTYLQEWRGQNSVSIIPWLTVGMAAPLWPKEMWTLKMMTSLIKVTSLHFFSFYALTCLSLSLFICFAVSFLDRSKPCCFIQRVSTQWTSIWAW